MGRWRIAVRIIPDEQRTTMTKLLKNHDFFLKLTEKRMNTEFCIQYKLKILSQQ